VVLFCIGGAAVFVFGIDDQGRPLVKPASQTTTAVPVPTTSPYRQFTTGLVPTGPGGGVVRGTRKGSAGPQDRQTDTIDI
jgi:hypothetical protein